MRHTLLASAAALVLLAAPAQAQLAVHDAPSNALRIAEAARALQQAIQQYQQLVSIYNSIAHVTDISGAASALGGLSRTYLPASSDIGGLMSGLGSFGQAASLLNRNRYYSPGSIAGALGQGAGMADRWAREMERREQATANAQALATAGMEDAQERIRKLEILRARVEAGEDGTENTAVNGLIAIEQQNLAAHAIQVQQARLLLAAEDRVSQQRAEQMQRESAEMLRAATAPLASNGQ